MTDQERVELAQRIVASLPKFGTWAHTVTVFKTPFGKIGFRQAAILWAIRYHLVPEDAVSPSSLADLYHIQPSAITRALARLEKSQFITRRINPEDGRGFRISITDTGLQVSEYIEHLFTFEVHQSLETVPDEDIAELRRSVETLDRLVDDLERRRSHDLGARGDNIPGST
jgi:DNA-binding MarR family transcriptional regulator